MKHVLQVGEIWMRRDFEIELIFFDKRQNRLHTTKFFRTSHQKKRKDYNG